MLACLKDIIDRAGGWYLDQDGDGHDAVRTLQRLTKSAVQLGVEPEYLQL